MLNTSSLASRLRGIIVPMVTPLAAADELDLTGLERLVDRLLAGGVHGLFVLGSCGEGPSLSPRVQRDLVDRVCRQTAQRVPVLVGVIDASTTASMDQARHAAEAGADAVVLAPPFYFPLEQEEVYAYFTSQAAESPLPVILYNMPGLTKIVIEPETVRRLLDNPRIIGLKDSSGDLPYFRAAREATRGRADWTLLVGQERLVAEATALGGDGGVTGGANVLPQLFVRLYEAARAGLAEISAGCQSDVERLAGVYSAASPNGVTASGVIKGLKASLAALNVCSALPCPPLSRLSAEQSERVRTILHTMGASSMPSPAAAQQQ